MNALVSMAAGSTLVIAVVVASGRTDYPGRLVTLGEAAMIRGAFCVTAQSSTTQRCNDTCGRTPDTSYTSGGSSASTKTQKCARGAGCPSTDFYDGSTSCSTT